MSDEEERQFEIEISKNGRASCKKCKQKCLQGQIRIAKLVPNPFGEGKMRSWHHLDCMFEVFKKQRPTTKRIEHEDDIAGFNLLSEDDQKAVTEKINEIRLFFGVTDKRSPKEDKSNEKKGIPVKKNENQSTNSSKEIECAINEDDLFKTFSDIVNKIANLSSYLDKTEVVKKFFIHGKSGEAFKGDIDVWCRLLLPHSDKRVYNLQSKQLIKLFSRILHEDQDEMLEDLAQGDISETVSKFYKKSRKYDPQVSSTLTVQEVEEFLNYLSKLTREEDQISHFKKILPKLTPNDLKLIIRLIKHDLRMGAGPKHILDGIHPDAYDVYKASKDLDAVIEKCFQSSKLLSADIKLMTPVFPMLAEPCKSVEQAMKKCPNGLYSEIKYDGERVQVHKQGNEFKYYSRSLKPVMAHKVAHFKDYISKAFPHAKDLILDSEILMMDTKTGKPLPFGTLGVHKKVQFKDATVCLFVFDCLYYNGKSLLNVPLKDRKKILNETMTEIPNHIVFSEMKEIREPKQLAHMIAKVLRLGLEGLVLKDVMSKYEPAKRHWLKVKKDYLFGGAMADSADLIVLGAWYGTGKKGGMMSVFLMGCYDARTRKFCTVTKVHTGHDDKTLEKLQNQLKMVKISGDTTKVPSWLNCTRTMVPDFVAENPKEQPVWEITGAEFTQQHDVHTADGISIRFPRVTRIRDDKGWDTATNLDELKALFKKSKENTDVSLLLKDFKDDTDTTKRKNEVSDTNESPSKKLKGDVRESHNPQKKNNMNTKKLVEIDGSSGSSEVSRKLKTVHIENPLPNIFDGIAAIFHKSLKNESYKEIKRYFIAYGGTVLSKADREDATHVVYLEKTVSCDYINKYPPCVHHVNVNWIVNCINEGKLVDYRKYSVKLTNCDT